MQLVVIHQLRQHGTDLRLALPARNPPSLGSNTEAHRLAQQRMRVPLSDQIDERPSAVRKDDAMDFRVILHGVLQGVVRLVERALRDLSKGTFGAFEVGGPCGGAKRLTRAHAGLRRCGTDLAQDFVGAASLLFDVCRVAVQDFQDR